MSLLLIGGALVAAVGQEDRSLDIGRWIVQLGSDEVGVREAATSKLLDAGPAALEKLQAASDSRDPEVRTRVDQLLQTILRRHVESFADPRRAAPVTLELRDVSLGRVVEAFRRLTPIKIELDEANIYDYLRVSEFRASGIPFREAFETFLERSELRVVSERPEVIRVDRPPHVTFVFRSADIQVFLDMVVRVTGVKLEGARALRGTVTVVEENVPWDQLLDRVLPRIGAVAIGSPEGGATLRPLEEFRKELESRSFPFKQLRPGRPAAGKPDAFAELMLHANLRLTRGASWKTLHGKLEYDAKARSLKVTDRADVLDAIRILIEQRDKP